MKLVKSALSRTFLAIVISTVICGVIYPLTVTAISQTFFRDKANGSIIEVDNVKYGSELLAQEFSGNEYLWGRVMIPNTEAFENENGEPIFYAGPSNTSPASKEYEKLINERVKKIKAGNTEESGKIPVDLVTISGSGLDPHVSEKAALYQVKRISHERNMTTREVELIINKCTTNKFLGVFGEKVVNVLEVNLLLDGIL